MISISKEINAIIVVITSGFLVIDHAAAQDRPFARDPMGVGPGYLFMTPGNGMMPPTLRDMVESADIIMEGTYGEFLRDFTFYGYDLSGNDNEPPEPPPGSPMPRGIPISEYIIKPIAILKGAELVSDGNPP